MKQALIIKTDMMLRDDVMAMYQKIFSDQLKTGVVLIPAYFNAVLVNVPTDVEVIIESSSEPDFLDKRLNLKGNKNDT